ncbi:unnamed protein product [Microthlaspi erraticum]|uniref:DUF577 domain-containing protein n=1 Tax=Microthlaspi erraticum TaxID=1685480 RepID=A0A6D2L7F8_9BRAS|nr:unnamed protein product [Microthlaspi erraticum]
MVQQSAEEMVRNGMEQFLLGGLEDLHKFLSREANLSQWNRNQCGFVSEFAKGIEGIGAHTKGAANKIYQILALKLSHPHPVQVLSIFASTDTDDRTREMAITRLHSLLSDHTSGLVDIEVSVMKRLQQLLTYCLRKEGTSDEMFGILGQVVFHVAKELFDYEEDTWCALWDYIALECKTVIYTSLDPPEELLCENSCWVLAFTGGFCVAINLLEITSQAKDVETLACKMIDSVKELVKRGMEVQLVRRAFKDLESIVEKQWYWYMATEYRFVKGLFSELCAIEGLTMEIHLNPLLYEPSSSSPALLIQLYLMSLLAKAAASSSFRHVSSVLKSFLERAGLVE